MHNHINIWVDFQKKNMSGLRKLAKDLVEDRRWQLWYNSFVDMPIRLLKILLFKSNRLPTKT